MPFHICLVYQKTNFPFIFEDANRLGINLTLVHHPNEAIPDGLPAVKTKLAIDIENERNAMEQLRKYKKENHFDGLLTLWEGAVPFVAKATKELKMPGLNPEAASLTRDKGKVREKLLENRLNCPKFIRIKDINDIPKIKDMLFPLIVKPAHGFGSLGVIKANDTMELKNAINIVKNINISKLGKYSNNLKDIVIEEYIDGPEYVAETFAHNGKVHVLSIGYKGFPKGPYFEESVYIAPAELSDNVKVAIENQVKQATLSIGITQGPTHTELRLNQNNVPFILEIGARLGGSGGVADMVKNSTGIDFSKLVFENAMGLVNETLLCSNKCKNSIATFYIIPVGAGGILEEIEGLELVKKNPSTLKIVQFTPYGGKLVSYPDFNGYVGMVYAKHNDYQEAKDYINWLEKVLKARYKNK